MTKMTIRTWASAFPLILFILILVALLLSGCQVPPSSPEGYIKAVVVIKDEDPVESVERWLLNITRHSDMPYKTQLKAAELYLLMNGYNRCGGSTNSEQDY